MAHDGIGATDRRLLEAELEEERRIEDARLVGGCAKFLPCCCGCGWGYCACAWKSLGLVDASADWECANPDGWEPA